MNDLDALEKKLAETKEDLLSRLCASDRSFADAHFRIYENLRALTIWNIVNTALIAALIIACAIVASAPR